MKKEVVAEQILNTLANSSDKISAVSLEDYETLKKFTEKERASYGNSWTYITQGLYNNGINGLGYKYFDGDNIVFFGISPSKETKELVFYWVRPMGKTIHNHIATLSNKINSEYGLKTIVKKIFPEEKEKYTKEGFKSIDYFPWHTKAKMEDDTYPELILDIEIFKRNLQEHTVSKRLKRLYKNYKNFTDKFKVRIVDLNLNNLSDAWSIVTNFFIQKQKEENEYMFSTEKDYYNMIFKFPYKYSSNRIAKIFFVDEKPAGLIVMEENNNDVVSLYALIALRQKFPFIQEFLMFNSINFAEERGYKKVNLGGSEYKGVEDAKLKYHPQTKNQMEWLVKGV